MNQTEPKMRRSRVLEIIRSGGVALCAKTNFTDPRAVELICRCNFDCIWLDIEHTPNTLEQTENQVRAAKVYDVDTLVRIARGGYGNIIHPLEMDATGIMVPHIMSLEDARKVAWLSRFHPIGRRPYDGGNLDGAFCTIPVESYMRQANEQRFVIAQIEDPEPLDELEEIIQVEGIDMYLLGPGDFSQGIGAPGQWDHPKIDQTRRRIAELARKHGKFAAATGPAAMLGDLIDMGYQFVNVCADVVSLYQSFTEIEARCREVIAKKS